MAQLELLVPDIGNFKDVAVVDVLVKPGDAIELETPLLTLETEKATMDVPATSAGTVISVAVRKGDTVSKGSLIARIETAAVAAAPATGDAPARRAADVRSDTAIQPIPDFAVGGAAPSSDTVRMPALTSTEEMAAAAAAAMPADVAPAVAEPATPAAPAAATPAVSAGPTGGGEAADRTTPLLVLGAGPGGYTAAFRAADLGLSVTLVERWPTLGGVCLNIGCIPSKALLHAAKVIEDAEAMGAHGISFAAPQIDVAKLRGWKNNVVKRLTGGLRMLAKQRKVEVVQGVARFVSPHVVEVTRSGATERIRFEQCIIAAGSETVQLPFVPNDPRVIDSTGALEVADIPPRLLVIGGGIIGLEMACVYDALGSRVSVVELTPGLMPGCDPDLVKPLEKRIRARYEQILLGTKVTAVKPAAAGLEVTFDGPGAPGPQLYDRVLVAVGRVPNGRQIGADAAGVKVDARGFVPVDRQMRTSVPHIFAIGDIAGPPMLAHKATHEAKVAAEVAAGEKRAFEARCIPSVAYTDPEVAWAGLTEADAKATGIAYRKGMFPWIASGRSLALGREEGFTKLLFDPETHRVLGGGIVGTGAGDLISEVCLAIEMGSDAADIGLTIHPHPTLSETVAFAAEAFEGTLTDLYIPKKT